MREFLKILKALPALLVRIAHVIKHIFCHDVPSYDIDLTEFSDSSDSICPPGFFDNFCSDDDGDYDSFDPPSGLSYDFDEEVDI